MATENPEFRPAAALAPYPTENTRLGDGAHQDDHGTRSRITASPIGPNVLLFGVSQAYRIVLECPKSGHPINVERKCAKSSLSEAEAIKMLGKKVISCGNPKCGWRGKVSALKLLRILPFNWIFTAAA